MARKVAGAEIVTQRVTTYAWECDQCHEVSDSRRQWLSLKWPDLEDHTWWRSGESEWPEDGNAEVCSVECLRAFLARGEAFMAEAPQ